MKKIVSILVGFLLLGSLCSCDTSEAETTYKCAECGHVIIPYGSNYVIVRTVDNQTLYYHKECFEKKK